MIQYNKKMILQLILEELEHMCRTEDIAVKQKINQTVLKLIKILEKI